MPTDSHRDRIVAAIRISSQPLDDDQLAARTGISPRQRVNQVCRALERAGMVRRRPGPDGKIVNEWLEDRDLEPRAPYGRRA
jgi:DNA-binding GntR family transcriptional regulator